VPTDTEDVTSTVLTECDKIPSESEVRAAVEKMVGEIEQVPPMYSAIKVGGKKLYDLAREGVSIEREARRITVYSIGCERINDKEYYLDVHCSKGTYIRTLCADIGRLLGCGGTMKTLERTECAGFTLADAHTLEEIENMSPEEKESIVIPTEELFKDVEALTLSPFFARLARCGVEIYLKKIGIDGACGKRYKLFDENGFFALGEVREFEDGLAVKPIKQFDI
jgi:tRNA pseudouridine55 synthase